MYGNWVLDYLILTPEEASYQLYKIPYGKPSPLLCKLESSSFIFKQPHPLAISDHWSQRGAFDDPEKAGQTYVLGHLEKIIKQKALPIHGVLTSIDVLLTFIGVYHNCLGLPPNENTYDIADISYALNQYLMGICVAIANQMVDGRKDFVQLDLDSVNDYVKRNGVKPVFPSDTPIRFILRSRKLSIRSAFDALRYLSTNGIKEIVQPFAPRSRPLVRGSNWVWSGYSREDEIHNITLILQHSIEEYKAFVQGNRLKINQKRISGS